MEVEFNIYFMIKKDIKAEILKASKEAGYKNQVAFSVENPPAKDLGDFSTNIALVLAGDEKKIPKEIAEKIASRLSESRIIEKASVAGAGFINIVIKNEICYEELSKIMEEKKDYGKLDIGKGKKVSIDYISANPTGPIHIGNARGGPIGEAIANLLAYVGYKVNREFYVNDIGLQVNRLGESLYYWLEKKSKGDEIPFPDDGYKGEYVKDVAEAIVKKSKNKIDQFKNKEEVIEYLKKEGLDYLIDKIKKDVELLGIEFNKWVYESEIQQSGQTKRIIDELSKREATLKREGAVWFKNPLDPEFKDKEAVLQKSDQGATYTYFADDIAYHMRRYDEGIDLIVDIWGSNHHGHVPRMVSALKSLGIKEKQLKVLLYQWINIKNGGELVKMSKRMGNFVTLKQLFEGGVSPDAFKYFILAQNSNTPIDLDIKLASDKTEKNPVYYIQYAHARICSILRKTGEASLGKPDLTLLKTDKELNLLKALIEWPDIVEEISNNFQIQALPHYAYRIASLFHDFYTNCQVLTEDKELSSARLDLIKATKIILNSVLKICGISTPEKM